MADRREAGLRGPEAENASGILGIYGNGRQARRPELYGLQLFLH